MSFLKYQKQNPEFLNNYLKYKAYIEFKSKTTVDETYSESKFKIRNYAITCLFLNCSLRLSELTAINLTDLKIDNSEQTLKVHGK